MNSLLDKVKMVELRTNLGSCVQSSELRFGGAGGTLCDSDPNHTFLFPPKRNTSTLYFFVVIIICFFGERKYSLTA
jgi:hypothetical protein